MVDAETDEPIQAYGEITPIDFLCDRRGEASRDIEQVMTIGSGTGAPAPNLNTKTIIQETHNQIMVKVLHIEGNHPNALFLPIGQQMQASGWPKPLTNRFSSSASRAAMAHSPYAASIEQPWRLVWPVKILECPHLPALQYLKHNAAHSSGWSRTRCLLQDDRESDFYTTGHGIPQLLSFLVLQENLCGEKNTASKPP